MGKTFLKIAAIYFSIGVLMGMSMGIIHDFRLTSAHAHVNLIGWASTALFGLIYSVYPFASHTKLAKTHFWLHNIGLPFMIIGIVCNVYGIKAAMPIMIVASLCVVVATLLFTINLFKTLTSSNISKSKDLNV